MGKKVVLPWKKTVLLLALVCIAIGPFFGQTDTSYIHKGLLRVAGTFAIGDMPENKITNAYLTGNLEYYPDKTVSFRGDAYFLMNSLTENSILKANDAIYFGGVYHFRTHSAFDLVFGFQPGVSYTQMLKADGQNDVATICPLASVVTGFNFFAEKWFHIQVNVRYTIGQHLSQTTEMSISELSFNFGLGFNLF